MEFPGGSDNYLTISGSGHPFLSSSETFHTPSLGDEEFEIPPISLDPDSALTVSDVVSHFGELGEAGPAEGVAVPGNAVVEGDDPSFASTFVSAPSQVLDHLSLGVMGQPGGAALLGSSLGMVRRTDPAAATAHYPPSSSSSSSSSLHRHHFPSLTSPSLRPQDLGHPIGSQFASPVAIDVPLGDVGQALLGSSQLTTIDQSELSAQLGLGLGGGGVDLLQQGPQSPQHPLAATVSPASSLQDDDMDDFRRSVLVESPVSLSPGGVINLDPSPSDPALQAPPLLQRAPHKPVSAYALFFRDTQAAIKGQNPNATFGEVSKIVASMWDSLGEEQKQVYKRKNETAKREYLKALAEYKVSQISQVPIEVLDSAPSSAPSSPPLPAVVPMVIAASPSPSPSPAPLAPPPRATRSQQYNPEENTITNICTSNIILDLPQVTTRSRTGAIKPPAPAPAAPAPPTVAKIIIRTMAPGSSPRQPPPLQQMQNTPPPPRLQQMVHAQAPPPLQAKPRGATTVAPPPLQIKVVPPSAPRRPDGGGAIIVTSNASSSSSSAAMTMELRQTEGEEGEEGMEVEVNVAPGPAAAATPSSSSNMCMRAGCSNPAVDNKDWDNEYCSNECVATHCRDVFMAWCAIRGQSSTKVA